MPRLTRNELIGDHVLFFLRVSAWAFERDARRVLEGVWKTRGESGVG